jgi:hypothetical protein
VALGKPPTRAEAAENLKAAAERLIELASRPVDESTQRRALVRARRALEDFEDAGRTERKSTYEGT